MNEKRFPDTNRPRRNARSPAPPSQCGKWGEEGAALGKGVKTIGCPRRRVWIAATTEIELELFR